MSRLRLLSVWVAVLVGCSGIREKPEPGPSTHPPDYGGGTASSGGAGPGTGAGPSTGGASSAGGATGTGGAAASLTACACAVNIESLAIVNCNICVSDLATAIPPSCQLEDDACLSTGACDQVRTLIRDNCNDTACVTMLSNSLLDAAALQALEAYYNCLCAPGICGGSCDPAPQSCDIVTL